MVMELVNKENDVLVSVLMFSYNHGKYLPEAIEGVLMQRVNFRYELVIHDDASTDNSQEVIHSYEDKYPDVIKAIYQKENQYSKDEGAIERIMRSYERGKYTAYCEGDDAWTDAYKLQKQVDFMECHDDYMACFANVRCVDENRVHREELQNFPMQKSHTVTFRSFIGDQYKDSVIGQTATLLYRNPWGMIEHLTEAFDHCRANGDERLALMLAYLGKIYYMGDCVADYRRVFTGDSWSARTAGKNMYPNRYNRKKELIEFMKFLVSSGRVASVPADLPETVGTRALNEIVVRACVLAINSHKKEDRKIAMDLIKKNRHFGGVFCNFAGKAIGKIRRTIS